MLRRRKKAEPKKEVKEIKTNPTVPVENAVNPTSPIYTTNNE